jgi:flagellar M-ring protein FliF
MTKIKAIILATAIIAIALGVAASALAQNRMNRMAILFANMDRSCAADITSFLQENKYEYKLDNDGRTVLMPKRTIYEVRMSLARVGLPKKRDKGYEIFDENQRGLINFGQDLNYRRAVKIELARSIKSFREVERARVYVGEDSTASIVLRMRPGEVLKYTQVTAIQHLVASAIDGLKSRKVSVFDEVGNALTWGYAE